MKLVLPILASVLLITSCTTAYKSGQTPDDVYYSPEKKASGGDYVEMRRDDDDRPTYRSDRRNSNDYRDDYAYDEDRYLRMKVRNRNRWSDLDLYYNDPLIGGYYGRPGYYAGVGVWGSNMWNPYGYLNNWNNWNFSYNPYYNPWNRPWGHNVIVVNPTTPVYNRHRTYNLNTFNRGGVNNGYSNPKRSNNSYQSFDNRPSRSASSMGNDLRRTFGNNSNNNSYSPPSRSSSNSSSSGSSSGGSSRSSAPVRKF